MNKFELLNICHVQSPFPTLSRGSSSFYCSHWIKAALSLSNLISSFHEQLFKQQAASSFYVKVLALIELFAFINC